MTWRAAVVAFLLLGMLSPATAQQGRPDREGTLKVGDPAPEFALKSPDGKLTVRLADSKGKMPVVLIFGSYT